MKALVLTGPSRLEWSDFPTPAPADDEVLLRIRACGICGSDIHGWDGSSGRRQPPLIMGHEAAGEIVQVGPAVAGWNIGDRVTFDSTIHCGRCANCRRGAINLCAERRVVGVSPRTYRQHGAFAEYLVLPSRILHRLPDSLSFEQAVFAEPVSIALHAIARATFTAGSRIVVIGSGMIGLLVIQVLRTAGARQIIAVDRSSSRLGIAVTLGATHSVNAAEPDSDGRILALTGGEGADAVFEVVGIAPTVQLATTVARLGGQIVLVGNLAPEVMFPLQKVVTGELTVLGSCSSAGDYPHALQLIAAGRIDVAAMTSAIAPLTEGAAWFNRLSSPAGANFMKIILKP